MLKEMHLFLKTILSDTHFNGCTYFVGGCVRDFYRDVNAHDIDIIVNLKNGSRDLANYIYESIKDKEALTKPFQLGNYPIYSITFKKSFILCNQLFDFKNLTIEIADTMNESFPDEKSRQRNVSFGSLKEDVMRRDFSINSGLIDAITFKFLDLGNDSILDDINNGIIRCNRMSVNFINKLFSNDPLRILRGISFAARFNFKIDDLVKNQMKENIYRLEIVSRERINAEVKKAFAVQGGVYKLVKLIDEINGLDIVFPKISKLKEIYQVNMKNDGSFTYDIRNIHLEGKTVFDHVMNVLMFTKSGYENGLAALYHDVGKIYPEYKNGKIRFINHEIIGSNIIKKLFPTLKIENNIMKNVDFLVRNHMKLHLLKDYSKKSLRKFIREIPSNELRFKLYDLCNADCYGTIQKIGERLSPMPPHYKAIELIENFIKEEFIVVEKPFRYFNGNEIMELLNIKGKAVGDAIKLMLKIQDEYGFNEDKKIIENELKDRFFKMYPNFKNEK